VQSRISSSAAACTLDCKSPSLGRTEGGGAGRGE
jgi:hypothetical protein